MSLQELTPETKSKIETLVEKKFIDKSKKPKFTWKVSITVPLYYTTICI